MTALSARACLFVWQILREIFSIYRNIGSVSQGIVIAQQTFGFNLMLGRRWPQVASVGPASARYWLLDIEQAACHTFPFSCVVQAVDLSRPRAFLSRNFLSGVHTCLINSSVNVREQVCQTRRMPLSPLPSL